MAAGFDPARFWDITMREVERELRGFGRRLERESNERMWAAWHTVAIGRYDKLPKLETLLISRSAPRRKATTEELMEAMKKMFLATGGNPAQVEATNE